jgi:3-oxoacyl-[acyl-carrier-protein] synthase II
MRCSSTKPVTGHCMGAGAALEAIITIEALRHQLLPPNPNCEQPDPACDLPLVRGQAQAQQMTCAASLSAGFWGTQAVLVFQPANQDQAPSAVGS